MVTKKDQYRHIMAIKRVADKINKGKPLEYKDYNVILRALACHYAVLELDIKGRDD